MSPKLGEIPQSDFDGLANMQIDVKLDRVTVVGDFNVTQDKLNDILREVGWTLNGTDEDSFDKFVLYRERKGLKPENKAIIMHNKYQTSWRLDTSNHLNAKEKMTIVRALLLMNNKHLTRIDIAFDYINGPYAGMKHRLFTKNVTQAYTGQNILFGRSGKIETIYAGKRKSLSLYRYYDKIAEQLARKKKIDPSIKSWERLELQLRGNKTTEWLESAREMLKAFKMPNIEKAVEIDKNGRIKPVSFSVKCSLKVLAEDPSAWGEIPSSATRAKYRKLIEENNGYGFNTDYADMAFDVLKDRKEALGREVESFLADLEKEEKKYREERGGM